jgi:fluoride exporter
MDRVILVALGGAMGSVARHFVGMTALRVLGPGVAWAGTMTVNLLGGCLMGVLIGWLAHTGGGDASRWRFLLGVGVLGGFTTFSAFSLDAALMIQRRDLGLLTGYVGVSVAGSIAAVFLGLMIARRLFA